jgi:hypothetical protein
VINFKNLAQPPERTLGQSIKQDTQRFLRRYLIVGASITFPVIAPAFLTAVPLPSSDYTIFYRLFRSTFLASRHRLFLFTQHKGKILSYHYIFSNTLTFRGTPAGAAQHELSRVFDLSDFMVFELSAFVCALPTAGGRP